MARKRHAPGLTPQQVLAERLRALQAGQRRPSPALDALTGKRSVEELAAEPPPAAPAAPPSGPVLLRRLPPPGEASLPSAPGVAPAEAASPGAAPARLKLDGEQRRLPVTGYTVYLGAAEVEILSLLANHLWRETAVRPSRSELIRLAVRSLQSAVEHDERAIDERLAIRTGEGRADDATE